MSDSSDGRAIGLLPPMHCLLAFEAVARNRQLARAAHELGLTKSALCSSIALLEHRLRLRLVRRYSPAVELTEAGRRYLAATQAFAREMRDGLHAQSPHARTQLRVSASRAISRLWLGPRIGDFLREQPRVELLLNTSDQIESVLGEGVDVALRYGGELPEGAVSVPLLADRLVAVARAELLERDPDPRRLPRVEHPLLPWRDWFDSAGLAAPATDARLVTTDLHAALHAALQGVGATLLPSLFAQPFLADGRLQRVGPHAVAAKPYHAVVAAAQLERAPMRAFLAWLQRQVGDAAQAAHAAPAG